MTFFPAFQTGGGRGTPRKPQTPKNTSPESTGGGDIYELAGGASVEAGFQSPIPALDFRWTWQTATQRGFVYTQNTLRNGINHSRERIETGHAGLSSSSLVTHYDDVCLPFATESTDVNYYYFSGQHLNNGYVSAVFQGRAVWAVRYGTVVYAETSTTDPTPISVLTTSTPIQHLAVLTLSGSEALVITASFTHVIYTLGGAASTYSFAAISGLVQVPLAKQPILARQSAQFFLLRSDWSTVAPELNVATTLTNTVSSLSATLVGFGKIGSRPPQVLWLEGNGTLATTDVFGTKYSAFLGVGSIPYVVQAGFIRHGVFVRNAYRLVYYDGEELDTRIFEDAEQVSGYTYYIAGVSPIEDSLYAEVNLVPNGLFVAGNVDLSTLARTPRQLWRFDFEIRRWSPVSEWTQWTPQNVLGAAYTYTTVGHLSGLPIGGGYPYGPNTRRIHIPPMLDQNVTYRQFIPPATVNPYSLRGRYNLASAGGLPTNLNAVPRVRTPGYIFPAGTEYLDKYLDYVYWGGRDTGGAGSKVVIKWGELGRMDLTDPGPLTATFNTGVPSKGRRFNFGVQQSPVLFPQIQYEVTRGATATATPEVLPATFLGHVDLEEPEVSSYWRRLSHLGFGRSKG